MEYNLIFDNIKIFNCAKCKRSYFINPASAVGIIVDTPKGIVFVLRKFEPKKDFIVMPGGFCEPYERIEDSIKRELFEETAIKLDKGTFCTSPEKRRMSGNQVGRGQQLCGCQFCD